jgi:hypothetical protein
LHALQRWLWIFPDYRQFSRFPRSLVFGNESSQKFQFGSSPKNLFQDKPHQLFVQILYVEVWDLKERILNALISK